MATSPTNRVLDGLRRAVFLPGGVELTDGQLLDRFIAQRDDAAFEMLLRRHSSMVWGVCRRMLPDHHDAEDAFQAVFLVLVRKATAIKPREKVANWLYGVAYQTARKARAMNAKHKAREKQVSEFLDREAENGNALAPESLAALDRELNSLPEKYRTLIVLCDLEGASYKRAAQHSGLPEGTVASRLARGRKLLAKRLAQSGLAGSGVSVAATLSQQTACASAPEPLVNSTINAARMVAAGQSAAGVVSTQVAALSEGVLRNMLLHKLTGKPAVLLLAILILAGGAGTWMLADGQESGSEVAPGQLVPAAGNANNIQTVHMYQIVNAYQTNAALADEKFTNKRVRVQGSMVRVERIADLSAKGDVPLYLLRLDSHGQNGSSSSLFEFTRKHRKELALLKRYQEVIVEGVCAGEKKLGRPNVVLFKNCRIVKMMPFVPPFPGGGPAGAGAGGDGGAGGRFPGPGGAPGGLPEDGGGVPPGANPMGAGGLPGASGGPAGGGAPGGPAGGGAPGGEGGEIGPAGGLPPGGSAIPRAQGSGAPDLPAGGSAPGGGAVAEGEGGEAGGSPRGGPDGGP